MIDYPVTIPIHGCTHATATVMTANDDVFDLQRFHRKFKHGKQIEISTMNKVGDVAMDENFPGCKPVTTLAGTRLSEQPIHRYSGRCMADNRLK